MKYETAGAFRAALEQRLMNLARETGVPLLRLRKLVVFETRFEFAEEQDPDV